MQSHQLTMIRLLLVLSVTVPFAESKGCSTQVSSSGVLNLQNDIDATSQSPTQPASQVFAGGWCANTGSKGAQINVHFRNGYGIKGIIIYPLNQNSYAKRVHVMFSPNGGNQIQEFPVPTGQLVVELNSTLASSQMGFSTGIAVTQLRFEVLSHEGPNACMRLELIGCPLDELCPGGCQNNGICQYEDHCACSSGWEGKNCELKQCTPQALGLADGRISASNIKVSSQDPKHPSDKLGTNGWCPSDVDQSPWVQITLDKPMAVSAFLFDYVYRADEEPRMFIRDFSLQYVAPVDSTKSLRTFADNIPALNGTHYFIISTGPVIVTDTIRIVPVNQEVRACFKLELKGCDPTAMCTVNWCKNNGACIGQNVCKCPTGYFGTQCDQTPNQIVATQLSFVNITNNTVITAVPSISFAVQGNVNLTAVPGKPEPVLTIQGANVCIKMNVSSTSASCITDIDLCLSGFTFAMDVSFKSLLDNTYIVSSGGNLPGHKGVALYYSQNHLYYIVSSSTFTWTLVVTYTPALNVWQHFEITWNPHLGVELLVNGHSMGTNGRPNPSGGSTSLPLAIACSHGQFAVNVNMMVTGIISWNFDRTMLVNAGIKPAPDTTTAASTSRAPTTTVSTTAKSTTATITTTATTTTTPQPPTTTPKPYERYNMTFLSVNGNILITPTFNFTLHNTPTLELNNNSHTTLHLNCTQHQYVELPNTGIPCMQDLATCQKGFTFKVELEFTALNSSQNAYILSSVSDSASSAGMAIYVQNNILIFGVKHGIQLWVGKYNMTGILKLNVWYKFEISWDSTKGVSVLIDGYQVIHESSWTPSPGVTKTNAFLIGKMEGEEATSCMNIRDLFTWTIHREVLVIIGVLTAPQTSTTTSTTTAAATTTTSMTPSLHSTTTLPSSTSTLQLTTTTTTTQSPPQPTTTTQTSAKIPSYGWNLLNINHAAVVIGVDYNLTVHGTRPIHTVGVHLSNSGSYIMITAPPDSCLLNPAACTTLGLTLQITMQFHKIEENTYILTSGGQTPDGVGIAILYRYGKFQFVLTTFNMSWFASVGREALPADWLCDFLLSWSLDTGIEIFVNNVLFGYSRMPAPHRPTSPAYAHTIFIGKQPSTSTGVSVDFTLKEFTFWNARIEVLVDKGIFRPPVRPVLVG